MSVVGPRPALHKYDIISKRKELGIDALRPGITGWAQINGRDYINNKYKIKLDYLFKKKSPFLILKIIIITIINIVKSKILFIDYRPNWC